jgi:predicted phage-related endonuclease
MIKCENKCPQGTENKCCYDCENRQNCPDVCSEDYNECGCAIFDEEAGLEVFKNQQLAVLQTIADICTAKKQMEAREKELKDKLKQAMEQCGLKKFESDILNITYVAEGTKTSIDSTKLKKKYPDIAEECSKKSVTSAYIKVTVKEGGK